MFNTQSLRVSLCNLHLCWRVHHANSLLAALQTAGSVKRRYEVIMIAMHLFFHEVSEMKA